LAQSHNPAQGRHSEHPAPRFQLGQTGRFEEAVRRFDEENSRDPNLEQVGDESRPRELAYAQWLSEWVLKLTQDASEELRLAARCQHLCRWKIPRRSYPMTRAGYLGWREALKRMHSENAGNILREAGYPDAVIARVQALNLKAGFPSDPESRVLEDALCLVFLEHQFKELASKTADEKMVTILQKTWKKMTPPAQSLARELPYEARERELLTRALPPL
jgi:hypothetical protein